jgi:toxin ParE1/3/4
LRARLGPYADRDLVSILAQTFRLFGPLQVRIYGDHIKRAVFMISEDPNRAGSHSRSDIRSGVRSFHIQLAVGRRKGAAHVLYYRTIQDASGVEEVVILRILADEMEPNRRVALALRTELPPKVEPEEDL